ncbi:MAG: dTMP kinase [Verrucomicrobiales bacterium]|nr:dTMP kinase [Verrucomicrobiales bacterium]MCP5526893.1 dTMP kinase [Verrucomicrobiales bacterium]
MSFPLPGGFLLVIEGIDGAGKSTQAELVARVLAARGLDVVRTSEPTNGPWGQRIRASATAGRMSPEEEVHAFIEDRKQHVAGLIRPGLAAGRVIISDRYYFSTVAYQGARGFDPEELMRRNEVFAVEPHLLVVIDLPPEEGLARVGTRDGRANEFETLNQLTRSREIFRSLKKPYLRRLDGRVPPEALRDEILFAFGLAAVERLAGMDGLTPARRLEASLRLHGSAPVGEPSPV